MASSYFGTTTSLLVGPQSVATVFDRIVALGKKFSIEGKAVHLAFIALSHFIVEAEVAARTFFKIVDEEFTVEPRCFAFACPTVARCRGQPKSSSMRSSMSVDATRDKLNWPVVLVASLLGR